MAVFKPELNWSTYQDKQFEVLKSLEKSFSSSLQLGQRMESRSKSMESALSNIATNMVAVTTKIVGNAEKYNRIIDDTEKTSRTYNKALGESSRSLGKFHKSLTQSSSALGTLANNIKDRIGGLDGVGRDLSRFSEASNQMIKLSGMSGENIREFRSNILGIVSDLNSTTGLLYNAASSYETIISVSQGITSNLDAIEEMTKPLLLTYETLDVNINTVADILNRFYVRYNFSSREMESVMDEIRGNTAGNSANAEATLANIKSLENWINYTAGDDNELRAELLGRVSHYTSWLENMGLDSGYFTEALKNIANGNWTENSGLLGFLDKAGISGLSATAMARSGQYEEITRAIMQGIYGTADKVIDSPVFGPAIKNYGLTEDQALSIWNTVNSQGYVSLEEFLAENNQASSMEALAEDKYVNAEDKVTNILQGIAGHVASIQEYLGIGVSDIALLVALTRGVFGGRSGGTSLLGNLGSKILGKHYTGGQFIPGGGRAAVGGQYTGLLGILQGAGDSLSGGALTGGKAAALGGLGIAGIGAGGALTIDGISDFFNEEASAGSRAMAGVEAAGGVVGAGALIAGMAGVAVAPWLAPVALAVGGIGYLGKKAYDEANALSGNAEKVSESIDQIETALLDENDRRVEQISQLSYSFSQETDLEKQKEIMLSSGLFTQEELQDKEESQLRSMIDSYQNAASAMDETSKRILGIAEEYYSGEQNSQQKDLVSYLKSGNLTQEQMQSAAKMIRAYTEDEDLANRITKYLETDNKISDTEWGYILHGKHWFDDHNLTDSAIGVAGLRAIAGATGYTGEFSTTDNMKQIVALMDDFSNAATDTEREAAWEAIKNSGLESEIRSIEEYADILGVHGYATGTNYISHNQLAYLHEGEAVVPKKYNPMANLNELEILRERLKDEQSYISRESQGSQEYLKLSLDVLSEIKEFLSEWKEDNIRREVSKEARTKFSKNQTAVASYMSY